VHFVEGRKWFFGTSLLTQAIDIADTFLKGYEWGLRPVAFASYSVIVIVAIVGIIFESRSIQTESAVVEFASQALYVSQKIGVLGSW